MATTTNFGWETPDDTDLVKDGALAIRTLGSAIDTSLVDLKGGTTGQILSKASNTDMDFTWTTDASGISATIFDAKGDLIAASAADTAARLAVGSNNTILVADSAQSTGLKWQAGTTLIGCQATKTTGQSIATGTQVALTFDTETNGFDTNSFHDNSTNNTRFTIPTGQGGYYRMVGITRVGFGAYGYDVRLLKNGGTIATACAVVPSGYDGPGIITHVANLAAGDYIEFAVQQGSGSNKTFLGNDSYTAATIFTIIKLGV